MANISIFVFLDFWGKPSRLFFLVILLTIMSITIKNVKPNIKPIVAGSQDNFAKLSDCSIAGRSNDQIEAATITPAENPINNFVILLFMEFFIKNTINEPKVVPTKGIKMPNTISKITPYIIF